MGIHAGGGFLFHLLRDVSVLIQRKAAGRVSKGFLYSFDIISAPKRSNGVAVPHIVEARFWQADLRCNRFELLDDA